MKMKSPSGPKKQTQSKPISSKAKMNLKLFAGKSGRTPLGYGNKFFDNSFLRRYILNKFTNHTNLYIFRQGVKK